MLFLHNKRQRYNRFPIAGLTFICQCHQPNLYVNQKGLLPRTGKLNDFSSYSYMYMYRSGPWFLQPTWTPAETYEFWCIDTLVNVYWIPWEELYNSWLGALPRKQKVSSRKPTMSWAPQIKQTLGGEWSRPLCSSPQVGSSKGPKPVVMRWSERVLPWRPAIFWAYFQTKQQLTLS